jgi:hypothetical protein
MVFLLVWDKDSYTRRFFVLFPCICILQPKLVHVYQTSSLLPSPLPMVASASLRLLYSFLYSGQSATFKFLVFFPFPIRGFQDRVSWTICLGCLQTTVILISASWVARITEVNHWCPSSSFYLKRYQLSLVPSHNAVGLLKLLSNYQCKYF